MAAGQGFKTFNTGDVLSASDVNGYLMQGIWVFANATARDAAVTSPQEGNSCYLKDTDVIQVYSGSAWVAYGSGDITGVTAGTGISGGGTSGTVTITNAMATEITAAGDIIIGTGSGTFDNLPIGTTGQVLTADTTVSPYKVKWAAAAGGGKVLQVVHATDNTNTTSTSTTYADSGLTASITPSATSSKVLVIATQNGCYKMNSDTSLFLKLLRGATDLIEFERNAGQTASTAYNFIGTCATTYLDSPATTSSTTYKVQLRNKVAGGNGVGVNAESGGVNTTSSITLIEIGA